MFVAEIAANIRAQMFSDHSAVTPQKFRRKLMASLRVVFFGVSVGVDCAGAPRVCGFFQLSLFEDFCAAKLSSVAKGPAR